MSVQRLADRFDKLLDWPGTKIAKDKNITETIAIYEGLVKEDLDMRETGMYQLTVPIMKLAKKEVEENHKKWSKHDGTTARYKTQLFELSIQFLKMCCRQQEDFDHTDVPWIPYCLTILGFEYILADHRMETDVSIVMLRCSQASKIQWAKHFHLRNLWDFIWNRIETNPKLDEEIIKNYVEIAVEIMKNVDYSIYETTVISTVKKVIRALKMATESVEWGRWTNKRRYLLVYALQFVVHRWGLDARDFILKEVFLLTENLISLIAVKQTNEMLVSETYTMRLIDDIIKLCTIDTLHGHRSINPKTEENALKLVKIANKKALESAHKNCEMSSSFTIPEETVRMLARWFLAEIRWDSKEVLKFLDEETTGESKSSGGGGDWKRGKDEKELKLEDLIHLNFGAVIENRTSAWTVAIQILTEILKSQRLDSKIAEKIVAILWSKRKSYTSEPLRVAFCRLLATVIPQNFNFGLAKIPSIDSILKYALSLISLPDAAILTEKIVRFRRCDVAKDGIRLIWDTISRTSPACFEVIRVLSALISCTEFDENSRFGSEDEDVGRWSLRKDIIEWLLAEPNAHCHKLLAELCQYHPIYCYEMEEPNTDDSLLRALKQCHLVTTTTPESSTSESRRPIDVRIQEIVDYVGDRLKNLLSSDLTLPVFVLCHEFSLKFPEVRFDVEHIYKHLAKLMDVLDPSELLNSIQHFSEWPEDLSFAPNLETIPMEILMTYLQKNLHNQLIDLSRFRPKTKEIVENLANICGRFEKIREKTQKSMQFNRLIEEWILRESGDPYEMTLRFDKFSFMLSHRHLLKTREAIITLSKRSYNEQSVNEEDEEDLFILDKLTSSTLLQNLSPGRRIGAYTLDAATVSLRSANVLFDDTSFKIYMKSLKNSPFLAQNIVRTVLQNGEQFWHLHGQVVKMVMRDERLLTVCLATIPNMLQYIRLYQIHLQPKNRLFKFLKLDSASISSCQKYLRNPKKWGFLMVPDTLPYLFGCEKRAWKRMCRQFWRQFETDPSIVCEKLFKFASESVHLGLQHRLASILKALTNSDYCEEVLQHNEHLKKVFELTYRAIFLMLVEKECSPALLDYCSDSKLRNDLFIHRTKTVPERHQEDFNRFELKIAFSVENFLKFGIASTTVDYMDFGLEEFYRQLNENLTEEEIRRDEKRNIYFIVDTLSTIWLHLPSARPHIQPIIARFKYISPAWTHFPQPPHIMSQDETAFKFRCRLLLTLKLMNLKTSTVTSGEFATTISIFLASFGVKSSPTTDLVDGRRKLKSQNDVLCILAKYLARKVAKTDEMEVDFMEMTFFGVLTEGAAVFPDLAAFTIPFLFKICVDFKNLSDFAVATLLSCLKMVNREQNDEQVVYCLAESVDSVGLETMSRFERINFSDLREKNGPDWFFDLARLFLAKGLLTHAFAVTNVLFDRLAFKKRNLMMIERTGLDHIARSDEIIELLADIYVAENNPKALGSLPAGIQNRADVRKVLNKNSKEWLRLVSSGGLDPQEMTMTQWMCGLPLSPSANRYLDSILRYRFFDYPKILDTPIKFAYFCLYHKALGHRHDLQDIIERIQNTLTIDEFRLMALAEGTASFQPVTIEEHVVLAVRDLREAQNWRRNSQFENSLEINEKTKRMVMLAELLVENLAYDAARMILKAWEEECLEWKFPSVDVAIIQIGLEAVKWKSGDPQTAEIRLRSMRTSEMSETAVAELAIVLSKITIEYRNDQENAIDILEKAAHHLNTDNSESRLKVLLEFHKVCMAQLSKLEEHLETRSFRMKKESIAEFEKQIQNLKTAKMSRSNSGDDAVKKTKQRVEREQRAEKTDVEKVERMVMSAANKAVSSAFQALACIGHLDDDQEAIRTASLIVFPLIDVIYKYETDPGVIQSLKEYSRTTFSSKLWLCAVSHLASKCFAIEKSPISRYLSQILCRLVYDYPYHVLHTILMYEYEKNGSEVRDFLRSIYSAKTRRDEATSKLREIVEAMRMAHSAYREIAKLKVKDNIHLQRVEVDGKPMIRWPQDLKIFKCNLTKLPIHTISQKIGAPGDLSTTNLITWRSWKDVFTLADGLSSPIIWEIEGSDGRWYKTVWKKEDVRQDVLVEQMFDVTNNMLEKRALRTYNVVPLDTECGIIEFCGGTVSLKELLCGASRKGGLHKDLFPDEVSAIDVSGAMRQVQQESTETRRRVFKDVCQQYSPVFRHFFYQNFPTAHIWRQKIAAYRQSLATWSVVCYIVGLGDRHASNILFDRNECTFVHIDLGMILEYSKRTLPVPEQVPFRISRDVLDPLLIEGIENGQLAEDCVRIMEKLKENGKVILGVASALLRETMSNFRDAEQQPGRPSYISEMAIGRLRDKLRGTDDGVTAQPSDLQIRRLLRDSTNSDYLSRMFCGWMPFL